MPDDGLLTALGLNVGPGKRATPIDFEEERELELNDLVKLGSTTTSIKPIPLKEIRSQHHAIAKMLAAGNRMVTVSAVLGVTVNRISILCDDPTFIELLEYYKALDQEEFVRTQADMHAMLANLGADSVAVLHQKLLDTPDAFTVKELGQIIELTADRTGHGKSVTVNNNVNHSLDEQTLARIRATTQGQAVPALAPEDRQALLSAAVRTTELYPEAQEATWEPSEGGGVREAGGDGAGGQVAGEGNIPSVD